MTRNARLTMPPNLNCFKLSGNLLGRRFEYLINSVRGNAPAGYQWKGYAWEIERTVISNLMFCLSICQSYLFRNRYAL